LELGIWWLAHWMLGVRCWLLDVSLFPPASAFCQAAEGGAKRRQAEEISFCYLPSSRFPAPAPAKRYKAAQSSGKRQIALLELE